jgi:hypothetical protein
MMPGEVLSIILPFAVRIVGGFPNNPYATSPGMVAVIVDILDPYHDRGPQRDTPALFNQDNRAPITDIQLSSMIPHANAESKSERVTQPFDRVTDVWIGQLRNHDAAGHGSIGKHRRYFTSNGEHTSNRTNAAVEASGDRERSHPPHGQ